MSFEHENWKSILITISFVIVLVIVGISIRRKCLPWFAIRLRSLALSHDTPGPEVMSTPPMVANAVNVGRERLASAPLQPGRGTGTRDDEASTVRLLYPSLDAAQK